MHSNWTIFKSLCRVIGGQDKGALRRAYEDGILPRLVQMADRQDLLPALALRVDEQPDMKHLLAEPDSQKLQQALYANTGRNMQTVVQALNLARSLNEAGITPTFLKGTAQLLTVNQARVGFRRQLDIDLVLAPEELKAGCQALLDAGYGFYRGASNTNARPDVFHDLKAAFSTSAAHHHLPPMVIEGHKTCVELHRHFLPRRFQRHNPLAPLLGSAQQHQRHGATFRVPTAEYQLIHMVLGKLVNDSYLARRDFPIREGCDYIELLEREEGKIDTGRVERHCAGNYAIFTQLVAELMGYKTAETAARAGIIKRRLRLMEMRYNSAGMEKLLNAQARAIHLGNDLVYSPTKLPAYLRRLGSG